MAGKFPKKATTTIPDSTLRFIYENTHDGLVIVDKEGTITDVNPAEEIICGMPRGTIIGMKIWDFGSNFKPAHKGKKVATEKMRNVFQQALTIPDHPWFGRFVETEVSHNDGSLHIHSTVAVPIKNIQGEQAGFATMTRDITEHKKVEKELQKKSDELKRRNKQLDQKTIALREIVFQLETEKEAFRDEVEQQVQDIILPLVNHLRLSGGKKAYLDTLEKSLRRLSPNLGRIKKMSDFGFTPREIELCNLIKLGMKTKEIAMLSDVSPKTIEKQRKKIRKKLGLNSKTPSLTSCLQQY